MSLVAALQRIDAARRYLHDTGGHRDDRYPCVACSPVLAIAAALDHLDQKPRDARAVRRIFHDAVCASGCGPESDHADRTQSATAAALRRFRANEAEQPS